MTLLVPYARFSPRKRAAECQSIATQMDRIGAYCELYDHETVGEWCFDRKASGKTTSKRPGLERAITLACKHKAALIVYSLSRLSRSVKDTIAISERLHKSGADLIILSESIDTSTALGRAFFLIMAVLNQLEREQISERTSDDMRRRQADGQAMGSKPPYGKKIVIEGDKKILIDDADEQATIADIKRYVTLGLSARQISKQLNFDQIPARGKQWHPTTVHRILGRCENNA